jgi:hypothetical protein
MPAMVPEPVLIEETAYGLGNVSGSATTALTNAHRLEKSGQRATYPLLCDWSCLRGGLQRLTRDRVSDKGPATNSMVYRAVSEEIHRSLAYTYFYLALKEGNDYRVIWPWESNFSTRFLSSYASTALIYPYQSADEGTLHDIEFLSPNALDIGRK